MDGRGARSAMTARFRGAGRTCGRSGICRAGGVARRRLDRTAVALGLALAVGCADPVASEQVANAYADRFVDAVGVEPDQREVLERSNNLVANMANTVAVRWFDLELGPQPLGRLADALETAGLEVTSLADEIPDGRPRIGLPDGDELQGCVTGSNPPVGATVSAGQTPEGLEVVAEFGGPPATVGCLPDRSPSRGPSPAPSVVWPTFGP